MSNRIFLHQPSQVNLPAIDLVEVQRESFAKFLETGIREILDEISPVDDFTGKNFTLTFGNYSFGKSKYSPEAAIEKGVTYDVPLKVEATVINKQTGAKKSQEVFLCDLPIMLEKGSFIINGIERAVVSQLVRAPGAYYSGEIDPTSGKMLYSCEIRPLRGSWLEFAITKNDIITVKIDRRRKFPVTTFLRAVGFSDDESIARLFSFLTEETPKKLLENTFAKDVSETQDEALLEIYRRMRPGDNVILDNAKSLIENMFFNPRRYSLGQVGRYKIEKKLKKVKDAIAKTVENDPQSEVLTPADFVAAIAYLFELISRQSPAPENYHSS